MCRNFLCRPFISMDSQPRRAHYFAKQSIVCYTLPELLYFFHVLQKSFLRLRRAVTIIIIHKMSPVWFLSLHYNWKVSDHNFEVLPKIFQYFSLYNPQAEPFHINKDTKIRKFVVCRKFFLPYIQGHKIPKYRRLKNILSL